MESGLWLLALPLASWHPGAPSQLLSAGAEPGPCTWPGSGVELHPTTFRHPIPAPVRSLSSAGSGGEWGWGSACCSASCVWPRVPVARSPGLDAAALLHVTAPAPRHFLVPPHTEQTGPSPVTQLGGRAGPSSDREEDPLSLWLLTGVSSLGHCPGKGCFRTKVSLAR